MNCVICNSVNLSTCVADLQKKPEKRRYKYNGPCCSMNCALEYSQRQIANTPADKLKTIQIKGINKNYKFSIPKT